MTQHDHTRAAFDGTVRAIAFVALTVLFYIGFDRAFDNGWLSIPLTAICGIYLHHIFRKVLK